MADETDAIKALNRMMPIWFLHVKVLLMDMDLILLSLLRLHLQMIQLNYQLQFLRKKESYSCWCSENGYPRDPHFIVKNWILKCHVHMVLAGMMLIMKKRV